MSKALRKNQRDAKLRHRRRDPRYALAMPWNWQVCKECGELAPVCCPACGGVDFNHRPRDVMQAALNRHGYPPALHPSRLDSTPKNSEDDK